MLLALSRLRFSWDEPMITQTALRLKTKILSGKRLKVTVPELNEGDEVERIVLRSEETTFLSDKEQIRVCDLLHHCPLTAYRRELGTDRT